MTRLSLSFFVFLRFLLGARAVARRRIEIQTRVDAATDRRERREIYRTAESQNRIERGKQKQKQKQKRKRKAKQKPKVQGTN